MNNNKSEIAKKAMQTALKAGADACRIAISNTRLVEVSYRELKPENIKEASKNGMSILLFVDGRYSVQQTCDFRENALKDFITNAVQQTRLLAEDPYRSLPDTDYYKKQFNIDLENVDPGYSSVTAEMRNKIACSIEKECRNLAGKNLISATAEVSDSSEDTLILASNGFEGTVQKTYFSAGASIALQDEGSRRPNGYYYASTTNIKDMPSTENIAREAVNRTNKLIGGKKIETQTLPIIIENRQAARMLYGLLAAMYGRNIQQKQSFLDDKKGELIASPILSLIDDPFIKGGQGSRLFDSEGIAASKRVMIDKGKLNNFYIDWYYSKKLNCEPTTGYPSNLVVAPGKRSLKEIMKDLGKGILVTGFIGGNSNSTTGDMSLGIIGELFENGESVQPVSEMNIADNHLNFWQKLIETGNDTWQYSSSRMPSMVFDNVVVAGV